MKRRILVTGGLGFIGSNFIRHLYNTYPDYEIWNFDLMTYAGNPDNLLDILERETLSPQKRYFFKQGDICDAVALHEFFLANNFDFVINFAAESHVDRSLINSAEFIRSNVIGVHVLINVLRHFENTRLIQVSTDEIYGDIEPGVFSTEDHPIKPSNPYAASKAAADVLVQSYIRSYNLPAIIVRGSNNFGPYQYPEKVIPLVITNLIQDLSIPVHGTGSQVRAWIHVLDFCEGIDVVMHNAKNGTVYNIAGNEKKVIDIITSISELLKKDLSQGLITHVGDRPGQDMRYAPISNKMRVDFGWEPKRTLDESLSEIISWYLSNEAWWQKIRAKSDFIDHYEKQRRAEHS